jgi:hypothetical protein
MLACFEERHKPSADRKFVVVDEGDEVPRSVLDGLVPR